MNNAEAMQIIELIRDNGNLTQSCRELDMSKTSFLRWVEVDPENADHYARAKAEGMDTVMEALLNDPIHDASVSRLDWDRKRWHASKMFPKKYGDKTLVGSDPENPLPAGFTVTFVKPDAGS